MKEIEIPDELLPREGAGREELKALYLIDEEYLHTEKLKGNLTRAVNRIEKAQDLYEIGMIYLKYEDNRLISHQGAIAILVYEDRRLNSALMVVLFSTVAKTGNRIQSLILGNPQ